MNLFVRRVGWCCLAAAALFLSVVAGGCGRSAAGPVKIESNLVDHALVDSFAAEFIVALDAEDPLVFEQLIDWEAILARSTDGGHLSPAQRNAFERGARNAYVQNGLGAELRQLSLRGGGIHYLRAMDSDGETRAVFRLTDPDGGGMNYCELVVEAVAPEGPCKAIDMYSYLSAERTSSLLRRMVLLSAGRKNRALLHEINASEEELTNLDLLSELAAASDQQEFKRVVELFEKLPDALKRQKPLLLMFVRAAGKRNEQEYINALSRYEKEYPDDASLNMLMIDPHVLHQRYDEALKCIDRLDKAIGGDPYLHVTRAGIHIARRDLPAARASVEKAIEADANMEHAYWMSLTVSLHARRFDETARILNRIRDKFHIEIRDLTEVSEYVEFVASPEYEVWRKANAKRQSDAFRKSDSDKQPAKETDAGETPSEGAQPAENEASSSSDEN